MADPYRPSIRRGTTPWKRLLHRGAVVAGAAVLALAFFLVLPIIQAIGAARDDSVTLRTMHAVAAPPPPPPPPPDEPEKPPEEEEPPPELRERPAPLDLSQLELALNPSFGAGLSAAAFQLDLSALTGGGDGVGGLLSIADLDQRPRAVYRANPITTEKMRRKTPGEVFLLFVVNEQGKVEDPVVQDSSDPVFEEPALSAIKKWRFEPGKRKGEPVRFKVRQQFTFPK